MGSFFLSALIECDCTGASSLAGCRVSYYPVGLFTNHTAAQLCQRVNLLRFFFFFQQQLLSWLPLNVFQDHLKRHFVIQLQRVPGPWVGIYAAVLFPCQRKVFHTRRAKLLLLKRFQHKKKSAEWKFLKVSRIVWCKYKIFFLIRKFTFICCRWLAASGH